MNSDPQVAAVVTLLTIVFVFLIARELMCWYWKINKMVLYQHRQLLLMAALLESMAMEGPERETFIRRSLENIERTA